MFPRTSENFFMKLLSLIHWSMRMIFRMITQWMIQRIIKESILMIISHRTYWVDHRAIPNQSRLRRISRLTPSNFSSCSSASFFLISHKLIQILQKDQNLQTISFITIRYLFRYSFIYISALSVYKSTKQHLSLVIWQFLRIAIKQRKSASSGSLGFFHQRLQRW